jgi:hypothetical protein
MTDANYCVVAGMAGDISFGGFYRSTTNSGVNSALLGKTATSFRFVTSGTNSTPADQNDANLAFFGN